MKDRIAYIMRDKTLTASSLAEMLGVQASGISHILSGRNNPSLDFISRFLKNFPEVNVDWFVLGVGNAYKTTPSTCTPDDIKPLDSSTSHSSSNKPAKLQADLFSNTPLEATTTTQAQSDRNKSELSFIDSPISNMRQIRRVMIFFSDHTVDSYDYCDKESIKQ